MMDEWKGAPNEAYVAACPDNKPWSDDGLFLEAAAIGASNNEPWTTKLHPITEVFRTEAAGIPRPLQEVD
ncbi:hypothetical protein BAUCODRAFT_30687 [Baudoinia panamericana UAMH 10762]|uniref:Uncharacterized protein n=1 Tax=Baudoinia panamericana (strain UAMH 10762) TaxID=717646 RepID=M2N7Y2_BAUPA|nr:uncharacterized protein BAUCODRAFT_30687 [Baudoinia panamericana UAMH 10762]EMD00219.1 hypothetical protein BAUCODRAFT_30687 [Baudoinia panamericana UAMH 10762]